MEKQEEQLCCAVVFFFLILQWILFMFSLQFGSQNKKWAEKEHTRIQEYRKEVESSITYIELIAFLIAPNSHCRSCICSLIFLFSAVSIFSPFSYFIPLWSNAQRERDPPIYHASRSYFSGRSRSKTLNSSSASNLNLSSSFSFLFHRKCRSFDDSALYWVSRHCSPCMIKYFKIAWNS